MIREIGQNKSTLSIIRKFDRGGRSPFFNNKLKLIIIVVISITYGLIVNSWYRPLIYSQSIKDYGLADIAQCPGTFVFIISLTWLVKSPLWGNHKIDILVTTITLVLLEFLTNWFGYYGTYDPKDILAYMITGLIYWTSIKRTLSSNSPK